MCSCLEAFAKAFLFITNLVICILSIVTIGASIWVLVDSPSFANFLDVINADFPVWRTGAIILIVISCLVFILTLFGCVGASKESKCMLGTYSVLVLLIVILAIVGTVLTLNGSIEVLKEPFLDSLEKYDPEGTSQADEDIVRAWDSVQQDLQCCGVESWTDWMENNPYYANNDWKPERARSNDDDDDGNDRNGKGGKGSRGKSRNSMDDDETAERGGSGWLAGGAMGWDDGFGKYPNLDPDFKQQQPELHPKVPESCCDPSKDTEVCALNPSTANGLYDTGCLDAVEESIVANAKVVGGIACGVILLMILNFGIATYMCCVIGTIPSDSRTEGKRRRRDQGKNYRSPAATVDLY